MKRFWLAALAAALVLVGNAVSPPLHFWVLGSAQMVQAQPASRRANPQDIAAQIYQQLPELPLENNYLNREGEALPEDTLVSRLIRYHLYIKNRPPHFRIDWKLTLADYLGAFEPIRPERYPGSQTLMTNPAEGDRAAIESLSPEQRNQLVLALLQAFTVSPEAAAPAGDSETAPLPPVSRPDQPPGADALR